MMISYRRRSYTKNDKIYTKKKKKLGPKKAALLPLSSWAVRPSIAGLQSMGRAIVKLSNTCGRYFRLPSFSYIFILDVLIQRWMLMTSCCLRIQNLVVAMIMFNQPITYQIQKSYCISPNYFRDMF